MANHQRKSFEIATVVASPCAGQMCWVQELRYTIYFDCAAVTVELVSYDPSAEVIGLPNVSVPENGTNLTLLCAQLSGGVTSERNVTVILSTGTGTAEGTIYCDC